MPLKTTDDKIKYNSVVLAGFEFVEKRPLGFFEFEKAEDKDKVFTNKELISILQAIS